MIIQPSRHSGRAANGPRRTYMEMDEEDIVDMRLMIRAT